MCGLLLPRPPSSVLAGGHQQRVFVVKVEHVILVTTWVLGSRQAVVSKPDAAGKQLLYAADSQDERAGCHVP